jgi:hypothetical protein
MFRVIALVENNGVKGVRLVDQDYRGIFNSFTFKDIKLSQLNNYPLVNFSFSSRLICKEGEQVNLPIIKNGKVDDASKFSIYMKTREGNGVLLIDYMGRLLEVPFTELDDYKVQNLKLLEKIKFDVDNFSCDRYVINKKGKFGFSNSKGNEVIPPIYDEVGGFLFTRRYTEIQENCIAIPLFYDKVYGSKYSSWVKKEGKFGFIDLNGDVIIPIIYRGVSSTRFFNNKNDRDSWYMLDYESRSSIDPYGNLLIDYADACTFSEGRAWVKKSDKYGFINTRNEVIIPLIYDEVSDFSDGRAWAKKDGKWGFIDLNGNTI